MRIHILRLSLHAALAWRLAVGAFCADPDGLGDSGFVLEERLNSDILARIAYENNLEILAARYNLSIAQLEFERFEKELSEFTPLLVESRYDLDADRRLISGKHLTSEERFQRFDVGMEKEFFNGTAIFVGAGYRRLAGDDLGQAHPVAAFDLRFPFLSSATKLRRVISRTFEENELFDNRIDFVNEVREQIQDAYDRFFNLQVRMQQARLVQDAIDYFTEMMSLESGVMTENDRRLLESEIASLRSTLLVRREQIESMLINLKDTLGLRSLVAGQIAVVPLDSDDFYGHHYMGRTVNGLYQEAYENDAEIRVLVNAMENAELKRDLALQGKWDISVSVRGEISPEGWGERRDRSDYGIGVGFNVKRLDPALLKISLQRADAEIKMLDAKLRRREQEIMNNILISHGRAKAKWGLALKLREAAVARQAVLVNKEDRYLQGAEMLDNLIDARSELLDAKDDIIDTMGDMLEEITELDRASGVHFQQLDLNTDDESS